MGPELADNATHEDIEKFVDQIVEDRKGEARARGARGRWVKKEPEPKGDAQKIAEERDEPIGDMTAETNSGSEDTAPKGEDAGQQDWRDDDLKAEVAAYGIDGKELADFTSREELDRALRLFDRTALEAGRKAMAESEKGAAQGSDEQGRLQKKEPEPEAKPKEGQYEIKLPNRETFDETLAEDLMAEFTGMRDHYEARVAALEARFAELVARAEEERFDSLIDSLDHADLFGKSGKETAKELERRKDLFVAVKALGIGLTHLGRPVDLDQSLVNRVARMVFAEELAKKDLKARTRKIAKQSNGRMGGSAVKAHDSADSLREDMRRLYKELENA